MNYGMTVRLHRPFAETVEQVRAALKEEGFGVLTEIDVRATLQEKLGETMEDYLILGACNPPLAHRALEVDRRIGLLLPCNVVVRADRAEPGTVIVDAMDPQIMVQVADQAELQPVADSAAAKLRAAIESLTSAADSSR